MKRDGIEGEHLVMRDWLRVVVTIWAEVDLVHRGEFEWRGLGKSSLLGLETGCVKTQHRIGSLMFM